jgi:hypothetical protein
LGLFVISGCLGIYGLAQAVDDLVNALARQPVLITDALE